MKKGLKITLISISILILILIIDFISIFVINRPLISVKGNLPYERLGMLYNTYNCPEYPMVQIKSKWNKFSCNEIIEEKYKVKNIIDKTTGYTCATEMETFYEDELYEYQFTCIKSDSVIVIYENGEEEAVRDALKNHRISLQDLNAYNIKYYKKEKYSNSTTTVTTTKRPTTITTTTKVIYKKNIKEIIDKTVGYTCATEMETFYEDELYEYQFTCIKSDSVIVIYENGEEEKVSDALKNGNIKINNLDEYNIKYYKVKK